MSNPCFFAENTSTGDVMKIEEVFSSNDFVQPESNSAKKPRLALTDTSQPHALGANSFAPSNQDSSIELVKICSSDEDKDSVAGDGDFFVENVMTVKEEAAVREAENGYFDRFVQKNLSDKTKSYLRNQNGSIRLISAYLETELWTLKFPTHGSDVDVFAILDSYRGRTFIDLFTNPNTDNKALCLALKLFVKNAKTKSGERYSVDSLKTHKANLLSWCFDNSKKFWNYLKDQTVKKEFNIIFSDLKKKEMERQKAAPRVQKDPIRITDEDLRRIMIDLPKAALEKAEKDGQFNWKLWTHLAYFNIAIINGDKNNITTRKYIEQTLLEDLILKEDNGFQVVYRASKVKNSKTNVFGVLTYFKGLGPWQPYMIVKKYYDELVRSGLGPKDSFWRLPTPAKYANDKAVFAGEASRPWGARHGDQLMSIICSEGLKYNIKIGHYRTTIIRRSLSILLERFSYSKAGIETEDLSFHYLSMEIDYKVAIYLRIWLHLNEDMEIFSDEFENIKKVDSVLYRFIADFRPDVIQSNPCQKPGTFDFKQIIHEIHSDDDGDNENGQSDPEHESNNPMTNEVPCLDIKAVADKQIELIETRPMVQQVIPFEAGNRDKNKRKRKSEAARVSLNGVITKLNECFNEINSVWAQNPKNTSLSLIPGELLKVRELVSDEHEKFTDFDHSNPLD